MKPIINPATNIILDNLAKNMPQSLLLTGQTGVGLSTIAKYLASKISKEVIVVLPEKNDKIDIEKGTISIDSIRRLYQQTRSVKESNQVIIIDYAERMATSAQNAFLKLLEEPGDKVYFIMATHNKSGLLSTIISRAQSVEVRPITSSQTTQLLDEQTNIDDSKRRQLLYMADGLPAEIKRLVEDEKYFNYRSEIMRSARDLLQASTYKKLLIANKFSSNREDTLLLLADVGKILRRSISAKPESNLISKLDSLIVAHQRIQSNGNIRLCLARFVM